MNWTRKRSVILASILFVTVELAAVLVGIWPVLFGEENQQGREAVVRMGVMPEHTIEYSITQWNPILSQHSKSTGIEIHPYFAASYDELTHGLILGSLDIIKVNPYSFNRLKEEFDVKPLFIEDLTDNSDNNRSVLVCGRGETTNYVNQTRGLKLTFVDTESFSGGIVPRRFLESMISEPLEQWFETISYAGNHRQAVISLISGKCDIAAMNYIALRQACSDMKISSAQIRVLWISANIPTWIYICRSDIDRSIQEQIVTSFIYLSSNPSYRQLRFRPFESSLLKSLDNFDYL